MSPDAGLHMRVHTLIKLLLMCVSLSRSCSLFLSPETNDLDTVSASRQRIEDKLVEEYRNCAYYKQTKEELGASSRTT